MMNNTKSTVQIIKDNQNMIDEYRMSLENTVWHKKEKEEIILITGASGFLALHLINELVRESHILKIICLVRNKEKFVEAKKRYQLLFAEKKLVFLVKDLIEMHISDLLNVDRVIHNAAQIHALKSFQQLKKANVDTSIHLYKLTNKCKIPISLISTLSVWVSSNQKGLHRENILSPNDAHLLYGGYAQTKWLVEYLAPPNTQIYRLGLLTANEENGIFPENDFFSLIIKSLYQLGVYPESFINAWVDISPVNQVAKKIVHSLNDESIIHIANQESTSLKKIVKNLNLNEVNSKEFENKIFALPKMIRVLLLNAFFKKNIGVNYFNVDLFQATDHYWVGKYLINTDEAKLLNTYISEINKE